MSKTCITCKVEKSYNLFNKDKNRSDGFQPECKECKTTWFKKQYKKNRKRYLQNNLMRNKKWKDFVNLFKTKCNFCDENIPEILDFHHINSNKKEYDISKIKNQAFNEEFKLKVEKEIKKCIVVCSNCHRKIHLGYIKL